MTQLVIIWYRIFLILGIQTSVLFRGLVSQLPDSANSDPRLPQESEELQVEYDSLYFPPTKVQGAQLSDPTGQLGTNNRKLQSNTWHILVYLPQMMLFFFGEWIMTLAAKFELIVGIQAPLKGFRTSGREPQVEPQFGSHAFAWRGYLVTWCEMVVWWIN